MSGTILWVMCIVIVVSLAAWLIAVRLADRTPYFRHPAVERRRGGRVLGGTHIADGRSVMPRRDAPASEGGNRKDDRVPDAAARSGGKGSGNPLDL